MSARALEVLSLPGVVAFEIVELESFLLHLCWTESAFLWATTVTSML